MTRPMRTVLTAVATLAWLTVLPAHGAPPESDTLIDLFAQRAPVQAPAGETVRLELPAELFLQCQPDLSDLRLIGDDGRQIPYAVERSPAEHARPRAGDEPVIEIPRIVEVDRRRIDRADGPPLYRERYRLVLPDTAASGRQWELHLLTALPVFTRRARIEAVAGNGGDGGGGGDGDRREVSVFRLRDRRQEQLRVPLPEPAAATVEIELEGEDGGFLEPGFELRSRRSAAAPPMIEIELRQLERHTEKGRTIVELDRPPGLAPVALSVLTTTETFRRPVTVADAGGDAEPSLQPSVVAKGVVSSGPLGGTPEADAAAADPRRIELPGFAWRGDRLRITLEDGDSPPLAELTWVAHQATPELLFTQPPGGATLYFGGGRTPAPRYDIEALLTGDAARRSGFAFAALGTIEPNPAYRGPLFPVEHYPRLRRWLLWATLALAVVALLVLTLKVARQQTPAG